MLVSTHRSRTRGDKPGGQRIFAVMLVPSTRSSRTATLLGAGPFRYGERLAVVRPDPAIGPDLACGTCMPVVVYGASAELGSPS